MGTLLASGAPLGSVPSASPSPSAAQQQPPPSSSAAAAALPSAAAVGASVTASASSPPCTSSVASPSADAPFDDLFLSNVKCAPNASATHTARTALPQAPAAPSTSVAVVTPSAAAPSVSVSVTANGDAGHRSSAQPLSPSASAAASALRAADAAKAAAAALEAVVPPTRPTQSQVYDRVLNAGSDGDIAAAKAALCQPDLIDSGYYRALYGSASLCDILTTDMRKMAAALGMGLEGPPLSKAQILAGIVRIVEEHELGQLFLQRERAGRMAPPAVRESDRAAAAAIAAAARQAAEEAAQEAAAAAAALAAAEAASAAAAAAAAEAAEKAANGVLVPPPRKRRTSQSLEAEAAAAEKRHKAEVAAAAAALFTSWDGQCVLPPLLDPLQAATQLADDDKPVSPTSAAKFVRRSSRAKRPDPATEVALLLPSANAAVRAIAAGAKAKRKASASTAGGGGRDRKVSRVHVAEALAAALVTPPFGVKPPPALKSALECSFPAVNPLVRLRLNMDPLKGLCVSAGCHIPENAFVLEYAGDLLTSEESVAAEERYYAEYSIDAVGCYMFWFKFRSKTYCIDSTCPAPGMQPGAKLPQHLNPALPLSLPAPSSKPAHSSENDSDSDTRTHAGVGVEGSAHAAAASSASVTSALPVSSTRASSPSSSSSPSPSGAVLATSIPTPPDVTPPVLARVLQSVPSSTSASASTGIPPAAPPRLETLGYGIARYINHSRTPNLFVRVLDCPSPHIRTDKFDGSAAARHEPEERKEHIRQVAQQQQADKRANKHATAPHSSNDRHVQPHATHRQDDECEERKEATAVGTHVNGAPATGAGGDAGAGADAHAAAASPTPSDGHPPPASSSSLPPAAPPSSSSCPSSSSPSSVSLSRPCPCPCPHPRPPSSLSAVPLNLHKTYPRLCFFASRAILGGEELTIDYGDRDKESIEQFPWLQ